MKDVIEFKLETVYNKQAIKFLAFIETPLESALQHCKQSKDKSLQQMKKLPMMRQAAVSEETGRRERK